MLCLSLLHISGPFFQVSDVEAVMVPTMQLTIFNEDFHSALPTGREFSAESTRSFQLTDPALRVQNMSSGSHGMSSGFGGGNSGGGGGGSW